MDSKEFNRLIDSGKLVYKNGRYIMKELDRVEVEGEVHEVSDKMKERLESVGAIEDISFKVSSMSSSLHGGGVSPVSNSRVKNATKVDGFDSKLEKFMFDQLELSGISFKHQYSFLLQPKFKLNDKLVRAIHWRADFFLPVLNVVIDTKGYPTEIFKIKFKMFQYRLYTGAYPNVKEVYLPSTETACVDLIKYLKDL